MLKSEALNLKKQFSHFQASIDYDFDPDLGWYMRVKSNHDQPREFLIKGDALIPYIVEVGLGDHGIGFKRLTIGIASLRNLLKKGSK